MGSEETQQPQQEQNEDQQQDTIEDQQPTDGQQAETESPQQQQTAAAATETAEGESQDADNLGSAMPDFAREVAEQQGMGSDPSPASLEMLNDVDLEVKIELGRTSMYVEDVLALGEGSIVEIDKLAGDPVDVYVNERLVARGEVLVLNDNFCIRISQIVSDTMQ